MAEIAKKLLYDGAEVVSKYAICDDQGQNIFKTYAPKSFLSIATPSGTWQRVLLNSYKMQITIPEFITGGKYEKYASHYKVDVLTDIDMMETIISLGALLFYICTDTDGGSTTFWIYGMFVDDKVPPSFTKKFSVLCTEIKESSNV